MENEITAHKAGTVAELPIAVGGSVATGDTLAVITRRCGRVSSPTRGTTAATLSSWIFCWASLRRREAGELRRAAGSAPQGLEVGAVLARDLPRALHGDRGAVARHDPLRGGQELAEPLQRRPVGLELPPGAQHRDLHRREVVAADEHAQPGQPVGGRRRRCGRRRRSSSSSCAGPSSSLPGHRAAPAACPAPAGRSRRRSAPRRTRAARRWAAPGLAAQPLGGRLGTAQRRPGEGQPAEQVVPVAVGGQQPGDGKLGLLEHARAAPELLGVDRRVDHEALVAGAHRGAGRLPDVGDEDDHVGVQRDDAHPRRARAGRPASADAEQLGRLAQVRDLGVGLLLPRLELLLGAVDPDHRDLLLQARLDVVVVAGGDVDPALLASRSGARTR